MGMKKINLLHLITELEPGGAENLLLGIAAKLDKKRFNAKVAYVYGPGTLAEAIRKTGVGVSDLSRRGRIDPLLPLRLFLLLRKEKVDILHTHLVHASIAGRIAAKMAGVKCITTTRHYGYYQKEKSLVNWMERKTAVFNDNLIAISNAVKRYLVSKEKYGPDKIQVLYNAVDLDLFDPADRRSDGGPLIGSVGRLYPSKGYDTLLRSMPDVLQAFPGARLMIAGSGKERGRLEELCSQLDISDKVIFLGRRTPAEIRRFLKEITLFVLASNWEGFGLAVVEAMASGLPVVTTKVGGLPEIVVEGKTGFVVPCGRADALAEKLIFLLRNPNLSLQMGREGRKRVETLFSLDTMMVKLETMYRDLLNHKTRQTRPDSKSGSRRS